MSFIDLKKRSTQEELEKLNKEAENLTGGGGFQRDPRYWRPLLDAQGSGSALIRFLPEPKGENLPFVKKCSYGFKGPGGRWYINESPLSIGKPDPVAELNSRDWNSGTEEGKNRARARRMRRFFTSNIYVVEHRVRREDEGKVFLYNYGRTIYDMLKDKRSPPFADQKAFNPFNFWEGANFRLRIRKKDGFTNYEACEFDVPGPLGPDDELARIYEQEYSLTAEVAPDKFEPYDVLKRKLEEVLGDTMPRLAEAPRATPSTPTIETDDDDDDMKYFQSLANKAS